VEAAQRSARPRRRADVEALRQWGGLDDAGYRLERFTLEATDPLRAAHPRGGARRHWHPSCSRNPRVRCVQLFGSAEQRSHLPPGLANGAHIWTQLFSERAQGNDLASLQARAELDGDAFVVTGQKVWSTWAPFADYGYLLARTEPVPGPGGITAFILDMRSEGVEVRPLREMTGTSDFGEVFLDAVRVPVANVIGTPGDGWRIANASLLAERGGVGAQGSGGVGAGLVELARTHRRRGRPAIEDGAVRQAIGGFEARARIQKALGYRVATKAAAGAVDAWDAPIGKIWFSELNLEAAEYGMALQGGQGVLVEGDPHAWDDGSWQDRFLYARAWTIAGGSNEVMRNLIAERGLGLPKEPRGK
jgi:alkylation response protein AidB-like acyl-CoA dehydrogenase